MEKPTWYALPGTDVMRILNTSEKGLSTAEAKRRLDTYGPNELRKEKEISALEMFLNQFKSFLILVLIAAVILSFTLGEVLDGTMILIIVVLNAAFGFVQEYRASRAIEALKKMTALHAVVLREGLQEEIVSKEIVPGDIIIVEEGRQVPADARIIRSSDLYADESVLTGESYPVLKESNPINREVEVSEMINMIFTGTHITGGNAVAVVTDTGINTEIGKIAEIVQKSEKEESPLQQRLEAFGKNLTIAILIICAIVFIIGLYEGEKNIVELFLVAVSLAVAAIPEALPAVITLTLAMGMQTMAKNKAVVKRLMAVETLGTTSVICSDKTGTLTRNEMTVTQVYVGDKFIEVSGRGYEPFGEFTVGKKRISPLREKDTSLLIRISALCNNASIKKTPDGWDVIGDPTEGALIVLSEKAGAKYTKEGFVSELPFSSERKAMSVVYKTDNKTYSYVKGAPENIIKACSSIVIGGKVLKLDQAKKADLMEIERKMAGEPLRVLALAYKEVPKKDRYVDKETETDLTFVGLVGMVDPPRTEVIKAIENAHSAGIRTVMITGDHKTTAIAIAKQIGIMRADDIAVTGIELDAMTAEELEEITEHISVYARVSPEHKVRILDTLMKTGNVVAMTGDGVNDAPALKRSDIGVSMGIKGTDVAKEASDIILQDDNYATIVKAIESGRGIYDNIRKAIKFMVSMNFMELFTVTIIAFAGFPVPLLPLQILWINLVTDSLPGIALAMDVHDPDIMKRAPRKKGESVFSGGVLYFIIAAATLGTLVGVWLFFFSLKGGIDYARTMVFTLSVMLQMIFVFNCRSESKSVFRTNPFSNLKLLGTVVLTILLQIFVVQLPFFQEIFKTVPLTLWDWGLVMSLSFVGLAVSPLFFAKPEENST